MEGVAPLHLSKRKVTDVARGEGGKGLVFLAEKLGKIKIATCFIFLVRMALLCGRVQDTVRTLSIFWVIGFN